MLPVALCPAAAAAAAVFLSPADCARDANVFEPVSAPDLAWCRVRVWVRGRGRGGEGRGVGWIDREGVCGGREGKGKWADLNLPELIGCAGNRVWTFRVWGWMTFFFFLLRFVGVLGAFLEGSDWLVGMDGFDDWSELSGW